VSEQDKQMISDTCRAYLKMRLQTFLSIGVNGTLAQLFEALELRLDREYEKNFALPLNTVSLPLTVEKVLHFALKHSQVSTL